MVKILILINMLSYSFLVYSKPFNAVARIVFLKGQVQLKNKKSASPEFLLKGDWLSEGSVLKTADHSLVKVKFKDGSTVVLGPKGEMKIEQFSKDPVGVINLVKGQIRSMVKKSPKKNIKLIIKTPKAAMGIRGTDYQILVDSNNKAQLYVSNGLVVATSITGSDTLQSDLKSLITSKGREVSKNQYFDLETGEIFYIGGVILKPLGVLELNDAKKVIPKRPSKELRPIQKVVAGCQDNAKTALEDALRNGREIGSFFHESH